MYLCLESLPDILIISVIHHLLFIFNSYQFIFFAFHFSQGAPGLKGGEGPQGPPGPVVSMIIK